MNITKEQLEEEIKVLQKASSLHANYSISQYKKVLESLEELEKEKKSLEKKVKQRTSHLEKEINKKQKIANELVQIAKYDNLTKLPNRFMFKEELKLVLKEAELLNGNFTLMFLDLDGFKYVNDKFGHDIGDRLLKLVAEKLQHCVRKSSDVVSRLGGDEFTIILKSINDVEIIKKIASQIIDVLNKPMHLDENVTVKISSSIGIYIFDDDKDISTIISKADTAMYEAKRNGKNRYVFFDSKMKNKENEKFNLSLELKNAYKEKDFINVLHPIYDSQSNIVGAEVLLRWENHSKMVLPFKFLHILEDSRLIMNITFWQIEEILKEYEKTAQNYFVSFNLSYVLVNSNKTINFLKKIVNEYNINTEKIYFEVQESAFSKNSEKALNVLSSIKELGFKITLDNFGRGFSSLFYLREYPIDCVKIDKEIVRNIFDSNEDIKFLFSILSMLKELSKDTIIGGIETKKHLDIISEKYNFNFQGFFFSKPLQIEKFKLLL